MYNVRPLFKTLHNTVKHTQLVYNLTQLVYNFTQVVYFFYTTVGRFICFTVLCKLFKQWSNSVGLSGEAHFTVFLTINLLLFQSPSKAELMLER